MDKMVRVPTYVAVGDLADGVIFRTKNGNLFVKTTRIESMVHNKCAVMAMYTCTVYDITYPHLGFDENTEVEVMGTVAPHFNGWVAEYEGIAGCEDK